MVRGSRSSRTNAVTKRLAARIGPTVWELDGPMPMLKRSKTLTGTVPVCPRSRQGTNEPCRLIPGRAREGHSQSPAWAHLSPAATRPRALVGINCLDTPLIPDDTPMTKKRKTAQPIAKGFQEAFNWSTPQRELRFASGTKLRSTHT